ncbi:MAG: hypothetical protein GY797_03235 [Deltaproteobacteria bacterium]|nr:hypothetical protein [Deltaproteobacteria bacterium]
MDACDITEIQKLIKVGADVSVIYKHSVTPLFMASQAGLAKVINLLKEYGAKE